MDIFFPHLHHREVIEHNKKSEFGYSQPIIQKAKTVSLVGSIQINLDDRFKLNFIYCVCEDYECVLSIHLSIIIVKAEFQENYWIHFQKKSKRISLVVKFNKYQRKIYVLIYSSFFSHHLNSFLATSLLRQHTPAKTWFAERHHYNKNM